MTGGTGEPTRHCDVLIVGGGAVGSALACALGELPIDTLLVEAYQARTLEQPSFDARVTALANGSQQILTALGLWPALRGYTEAIRSIHISERGRFGAARILASEEHVPALGYTVENQALGRALWQRLSSAARVTALTPAKVGELSIGTEGVTAPVEHAGESLTVHAKLVVAADGARSAVRTALGMPVAEHDYEQQAVIFNCATEKALQGRAFERFMDRGPLALLPMSSGRAAVIWTLPTVDAAQTAKLSDREFRDALQEAFGQRLGRFVRIGQRYLHPLMRIASGAVHGPRTVLIGDAALRMHPVAGQGFNLALRDVATLAEVLADAIAAARESVDVGAPALLDAYADWRAADRRRVASFTHGLIQLFGDTLPGLGLGRGLGLMAFDLLPGAKTLLAQQTMGKAGRLPRLARGLPLK